MKPNNKLFLATALADLISNNVKVVFASGRYVRLDEDKAQLGGYFSAGPPKILTVATGISEKRWFPLFLHEYCHFRQFIEGDKTFNKIMTSLVTQDFDDLIGGRKEFSQDKIDYFCRTIQKMELNCEHRVVESMELCNLEIDKDAYIKQANSYIFLYTLIRKDHKWPTKKMPYAIPEIAKIMKPYLLDSYEELDPMYIEYARKLCYV
jgi:hypothetical protein